MAPTPNQKSVRHKTVRHPDGSRSLEERPVTQKSRATREELLASLTRLLTKRQAERPVQQASARQLATAVRKATGRSAVKAESLRVLGPAE